MFNIFARTWTWIVKSCRVIAVMKSLLSMMVVVVVAVPARAEQMDDLQMAGRALREENALSGVVVLSGLALALLLEVQVVATWRVVTVVERTDRPVVLLAAAVQGLTVLVDVEVVTSYCIAVAYTD